DAEPRPLALAQPADPRGKALELDLLARYRDPAPQVLILREQLEDEVVRAVDVLQIARQRHPPERTLPLAEERTDVRRDEARVREGVGEPGVLRLAAEVVPVVEGNRAASHELHHRLAVDAHRLHG